MLEEYKQDREVWEENIDTINLRSDILVSDRALKLLGEVSGKTVLDLGCGNGKIARKLAERGAKVFAIDAIKEQIDFAKKIEEQRKQGIHHFVLRIEELEDANFLPETFDIILSLMTHLYLPEEEFIDSFKIISKKLSPGGRFIYGNAHPSRILLYPNADTSKTPLVTESFPTLGSKVFKTQYYIHPMDFVRHSILDADFKIQQVYEPKPSESELRQYPTLFDPPDYQSPQYLLIDCVK